MSPPRTLISFWVLPRMVRLVCSADCRKQDRRHAAGIRRLAFLRRSGCCLRSQDAEIRLRLGMEILSTKLKREDVGDSFVAKDVGSSSPFQRDALGFREGIRC